MLTFPNIDPIAITIGPIKVHWYGLMYLVGFIGVYFLGRYRTRQAWSPITSESIEDLVTYGALGVILGGRIGYILFYNTSEFMYNPMVLIKIWEGGMSFHGGMLGVFISMWLYSRKVKCSIFQLTDIIAPLAPIGLGAGRIGNFINSELWGKPTSIAWGMIFPNGGEVARHPSQLYEAFLEGFLLFIILWVYSQKERPIMSLTGMALSLYGCFRFFVEFYRMPDAHIGYLAFNWLTMGQILSLPMVFGGAIMVIIAYNKKNI
ncbi:MAG: prolipoprotein diacylglyceryl transferase [Methylovulum sp.]